MIEYECKLLIIIYLIFFLLPTSHPQNPFVLCCMQLALKLVG